MCPYGLYGRNYVYGSDRDAFDEWEEILDVLESIPAADVAIVAHGEWKYDHTDHMNGDFAVLKCSECGYMAYAISEHVMNGNYCPMCGAKMDGGIS